MRSTYGDAKIKPERIVEPGWAPVSGIEMQDHPSLEHLCPPYILFIPCYNQESCVAV